MKLMIASADYTPDGGGIGAYANGLWRGLIHSGCEASVLSRVTPARMETASEHMVPVALGGSAGRNGSGLSFRSITTGRKDARSTPAAEMTAFAIRLRLPSAP